MKVALCVIGRLENQYAIEYVEWYKKIGFDKIFIYDNNHDGEEHFEDVLQTYIDDGFVTVIGYRNKEAAQLSAYNDCYSKYGNEYDWIAFFDFDEFLTLVEDDNIHSFLSRLNDFECIKINWMVYTDNDLVINDHRPLLERFTTPMEYDKHGTYNFPENNHVKSMVKGGIENFKWSGTPHTPNMGLKYCDSLGNKSNESPFNEYDYTKAYIKHFITKTIDEWINKKQIRGAADRTKRQSDLVYTIESFFKYNKKTKEKIDYIDNVYNNNIDIYINTHKNFEPIVENKVYKVIDSRLIEANLPLKDDFYSELYNYKYVYDNVPLKKYVGFCHYRRYLSFLDDIPNMDELFNEYDCVVGKPLELKMTTREHYAIFHNIEDLEIVENIIKEKYNEYYGSLESFLDNNLFIPYNMFIMKSEDFKEYCEFIFGVIGEYLNIVGTDIKGRIENNKEKYLKDFSPNNTVEYQYRIGGYIIERLTNAFMIKHFKKIKWYKVLITENKYNLKNNSV